MPKKVDPVVSMAGSFQNTAVLLEKAVRERHGSFAEALVLLGRPEHEKEIREIASILACLTLPKVQSPTTTDIDSWITFYQKFFPHEFNEAGDEDALRAVRIPESQGELTRTIVMLKGLTLNRVYDECAKHFPCWRYTEDLDKSVPTNHRSPANGAYAIRVRADTEADEQYKNKSAKEMNQAGVMAITLLERMLLELKHFDETGGHLDIQNVTLCAGSRGADGVVPGACWRGGRFYVYWLGSSPRDPCLRVREVLC